MTMMPLGIDAVLQPVVDGGSRRGIPAAAEIHEKVGYAASFSREHSGNPFLPVALAATSTERIELGTSVSIAFARSPMDTAYLAHDLQALTDGRFVLGLGTQIRPHITRRFSMGWDKPTVRMGDYITALKAIWASWRDGTRLDHVGPYYQHTLMTPAFTPQDHGHGDPLVHLAAVGPAMTNVAATLADGLITHPFASSEYQRQITVPQVEATLSNRGRSRENFRISGSVLVATGRTDAEMDTAITALRARIAFYGSTPAYRKVLEFHGWEEVGDRLHALSVSFDPGKWDAMAEAIPDEMLRTIGIVAKPEHLADEVRTRYEGVLERICINNVVSSSTEIIDDVVADLVRKQRVAG
ncbi:TIGR03617 family F420-dependent LLM class oxidoreductase [Rhodococcus sp. ARC_M6]|uniref:TIGR03617 family F420-dependent LLM class oxidoreductase n=1 Tax=Rhodococcus sp. ARC_M6 TaxID=2928852 RepID=UPI001FB40152|nr:TIGR03617 family F420-dependent LLM class oxidoreductase [Rhodococcus sp. ARC_M6]MCJ0907219.1 TIGR03617 family F420-dependent LLM class oxidoreductase [Rhodococcus sp. ARC_M6]